MRLLVPLLLLAWLPVAGHAEEWFPAKDWVDSPDPLASADAVVGGQISIFPGQYPQSFNYYLDNNSFTAQLFGLLFDTLLTRHSVSLDYEPLLAEKWSISDDKKTFVFVISPKAKWSDGKAITAEDVKFTFDTLMNPKNLTGVHKVALERFEAPVVIDARTIKFTAKEVHWSNLDAIGSLEILPKHELEGKDFNKVNFEFPVISGLYRLDKIKDGVFVTVERRTDWWRKDSPSVRGIGNFQTLKFKFYKERPNAFEAFKKGEIDLYAVYTARIWVNETKGEKFDRNWIVKQKVYNYNPIGFQGFAMNMRRPPFDELSARKAIALLLDRERMNDKLMFNQYFLHRSYYEDLYDKAHTNGNETIRFDVPAARKLLADAGWKVNPKDGILERDGRRFSFTFLKRSQSADKFLAIFEEALKQVGIEMKIEAKDWASWSKDMDEFNFDLTWAAWGAGVFKDPEGMWHSKEATRTSGNNITGYTNAVVDHLVERQKTIFDVGERHEIARQIDALVYKDFPYALLWNNNYTRLLYWNKFGTPPTVLSKYGSESAAYGYWWYDEDAAADLEDAIADERPLPRKKLALRYDDEVR